MFNFTTVYFVRIDRIQCVNTNTLEIKMRHTSKIAVGLLLSGFAYAGDHSHDHEKA